MKKTNHISSTYHNNKCTEENKDNTVGCSYDTGHGKVTRLKKMAHQYVKSSNTNVTHDKQILNNGYGQWNIVVLVQIFDVWFVQQYFSIVK